MTLLRIVLELLAISASTSQHRQVGVREVWMLSCYRLNLRGAMQETLAT